MHRHGQTDTNITSPDTDRTEIILEIITQEKRTWDCDLDGILGFFQMPDFPKSKNAFIHKCI